jgi:hypothetical protein
LYVVGPSQGGNLISNITHNLTEAGSTIAAITSRALEMGADEVEVTIEAQQAWVALVESSTRMFLGNSDCTPGYYNNEGKEMGRRERLNATGYPEGPVAYFQYIDAWRNSGDFEGLEFRSRAAAAP